MIAIGNISPALTQNERNYVMGLTHKRVKEYSERSLSDEILSLITRTLQECGQTMPSADRTLICKTLAKDLKDKCPNITIWDLSGAFRNGRLKEYGEWFGLNANTFTMWAIAYMASQDRAKALIKQTQYEQTLKQDPDVVDELRKAELNKQSANFFFNEWRTKPKMNGMALDCFKGFCCSYYDSLGVEIDEELFDKAIDTIMNTLENKKASLIGFREAKETLKQIADNPKESKEVMSEYKFFYVKKLIDGTPC